MIHQIQLFKKPLKAFVVRSSEPLQQRLPLIDVLFEQDSSGFVRPFFFNVSLLIADTNSNGSNLKKIGKKN